MNNLSDRILEKLKEAKITPKSKWKFLLKDYLVWISGVLSLVIGSISFAVAIFLIRYNDWGMGKQMVGSFWKFTLLTLPYFWIICLGIFTFLLYLNFKYTKNGYKHSFYNVVFGIILLSVVFGTLFYSVGLGQAIEDTFARKIPFYRTHLDPRIRTWDQPEKGFLIGEIKELNDKGILIKNPKGKEWLIKNLPNKNLKRGEMLKVIGEKLDDENFKASDIKPFIEKRKNLFQKMRERINERK